MFMNDFSRAYKLLWLQADTITRTGNANQLHYMVTHRQVYTAIIFFSQ